MNNYKILLLLLLSFACSQKKGHQSVPVQIENETQNGGDIIFDSENNEYRVADLSFRELPNHRYVIDTALLNKIKEVLDFTNYKLHMPLLTDEGTKEFVKHYVAHPIIEYRFVDQLPSHCGYIPSENLPEIRADNIFHAGCTDGFLTFIVAKYFAKLNLLQKALFVIHERLHALPAEQPYDIKTSFVKALYVLNSKYLPALKEPEKFPHFAFSPDELAVLNLLPTRIRQLTGRIRDEDVMGDILFTKEGGLLITAEHSGTVPSWKIIEPSPASGIRGVTIKLGTIIESTPELLTLNPVKNRDIHRASSEAEIEDIFNERVSLAPFVNYIVGSNFVLDRVSIKFTGSLVLKGYNAEISQVQFQRGNLNPEYSDYRTLTSPNLSFHNVSLTNLGTLTMPPQPTKYSIGNPKGDKIVIQSNGEEMRYKENIPVFTEEGPQILDEEEWNKYFARPT